MPSREIDVKTLLRRKITRFQSCFGGPPVGTITLAEFLGEVRGDTWRTPVEKIRRLQASGDSKEAQRCKIKLPVVKVAGEFTGSKTKDLRHHSGLILLDLDNLGTEVDRVAGALKDDPTVLALFRSPRGNGLKVVVAADASDEASHRECFAAAKEHFESTLKLPSEAGVDPTSGSPSSNCFLSHDRAAWRREGGTVLSFSSDTGVTQSPQSTQTSKQSERKRKKEEIISGNSVLHPSDMGHRLRGQTRRVAALRLAKLPPRLRELFNRWIGRRPVVRGVRHEFLLKAIPGAIHVFSLPILRALLELHHDLYAGVWSTTRETHLTEVDRMISDVEARFVTTLSVPARAFYVQATDAERTTFRVCRDLASRSDGTFYLSCHTLAPRLGQKINPLGGGNPNTAKRALAVLSCEGFIERIRRGDLMVPANAGQRLLATEWRWCEVPAPPCVDIQTLYSDPQSQLTVPTSLS